jgi:hypothetical protein
MNAPISLVLAQLTSHKEVRSATRNYQTQKVATIGNVSNDLVCVSK